jgi:hypothetical protein
MMARLDRVASAKANRRRKSIESFASAKECIGPLEPGMSLFAITRGQFSMIDVINDLIWKMGSADVSVWTWAIAEYEVEVFTALMDRQEIRSGRLVIDYSAEHRNAGLIQQWRDRFGDESVRIVRSHAKIARVWNDDYRFLARGSMNLNYNPRFEQFDLTEGGDDFEMVAGIEDELQVLRPMCARRDAENNSQLERAWKAEQIEMFGPKKVWAK